MSILISFLTSLASFDSAGTCEVSLMGCTESLESDLVNSGTLLPSTAVLGESRRSG